MKEFFLSFLFSQARKILSPISALQICIISFNIASPKNFPTGPFPFISLSFSNEKYAKPEAP